jgi:hypothetical protein
MQRQQRSMMKAAALCFEWCGLPPQRKRKQEILIMPCSKQQLQWCFSVMLVCEHLNTHLGFLLP